MPKSKRRKAPPASSPPAAVPIGQEASVEALRPAPTNPRKIGEDALAGLSVSLENFGDLAGVVWNERSGHLVAGHQRMKALLGVGAKTWTRSSKTEGFILHPKTGERFGIRIVDWDEKAERAANLTANNPAIAGTWEVEMALDQVQGLDHDDLFGDLELGELEAELAAAAAAAEKDLKQADAGGSKAGDRETFDVVVECRTAAQRKKLLQRFRDEGLRARAGG